MPRPPRKALNAARNNRETLLIALRDRLAATFDQETDPKNLAILSRQLLAVSDKLAVLNHSADEPKPSTTSEVTALDRIRARKQAG